LKGHRFPDRGFYFFSYFLKGHSVRAGDRQGLTLIIAGGQSLHCDGGDGLFAGVNAARR
jgi:hypothetical protein